MAYIFLLIIDTFLTSRSTQQNKYAELVFNVMKNIRIEKISVSVGKLDTDQLDVLMKCFVSASFSNIHLPF